MQSETLAQEFARLVKEYHEGDDHTKPEAWNLLADYAVDNADAIAAALSDQERAVEADIGTLRTHIGKSTANDCWFVRVYPCLSENDARAVQSRIRSALVDVPVEPVEECEPVGWYMHLWNEADEEIKSDIRWGRPTSEDIARAEHNGHDIEYLYSRPPHREGEDSAEVIEEGAKILAKWIGYAWDGLSDRDISAEYKDWAYNGIGALGMQGGKPALRKIAASILALAATRSGSATTQTGTGGGE